MKVRILFCSLALLLTTVSCGDQGAIESGVDFDITFKATYDGEVLEKNKTYSLGNLPLFVEACRLYLSDITLINGNESNVLSEIEYLDFTPTSAASATPVIRFRNVPEGEYTGIRLGFGVKPELNAKRPSNFPAGHPLSSENDYWSGWKSYIFSVLDGKADSDNNGSFNLPFSYHCGSDAVYKVFEFYHPVHVHADGKGAVISFDMKKFLTNTDGSDFDIVAMPATSNDASNVVVAQLLSAHFEYATQIAQ